MLIIRILRTIQFQLLFWLVLVNPESQLIDKIFGITKSQLFPLEPAR